MKIETSLMGIHKADGIIELYNDCLEFGANIKFDVASLGLKDVCVSCEKYSLNISFSFEGDFQEFQENMGERADLEIQSIANKLAYYLDLPIKSARIKTVQYTDDLREATTSIVEINSDASIYSKQRLDEDNLSELRLFMAKELSEEEAECVWMYKQAVSEKNAVLKFLLLYRLLEKIVGKNKIQSFISTHQPQVELKSDKRGIKVNVYTWLRDHIHPKSVIFPYEEIKKHLHSLQLMAKIALWVHYPSLKVIRATPENCTG